MSTKYCDSGNESVPSLDSIRKFSEKPPLVLGQSTRITPDSVDRTIPAVPRYPFPVNPGTTWTKILETNRFGLVESGARVPGVVTFTRPRAVTVMKQFSSGLMLADEHTHSGRRRS